MNDASPGGPLIQLEAVSKRYGTGELAVDALKDVSLSIGRGELVVVLGPSGSGKTTLLNLIGGIEAPSAGRLVVDGTELGELGGDALTAYRRSTVGFIFQFFNLVPTLTALENVQLIAELEGPDAVIRRGDLLWTDFGVVGMRLKTDTQHLGYVLRVGETEAPESFRKCLAASSSGLPSHGRS